MRYISHYEEYPIYEPAEGGYYYQGNQLVTSERKSKRACKKNLLEIWEECKQDNAERGFREDNKDISIVKHGTMENILNYIKQKEG